MIVNDCKIFAEVNFFFCFSLVTLNGTRSGNMTQNFTGFMLYAYNEFDDEDSGDFLSPLPAGVSKRECLFNDTGQFVSKAHSNSEDRWQSLEKF